MKKLALLFATVLFGMPMAQAETPEEITTDAYRYGNSFIFNENGITFSVYPNGEFDFYIDNQVNVGVSAQVGNVGITFNSGYNYDPYVQYDDYGAVVQVENIPIFYDYYGRVSQIGSINVSYRNNLVYRVGGLHIYYNGGVYSHCSGYINVYNRHYVFAPFHRYFLPPAIGFRLVSIQPYRRYYHPVRYTYYVPYRNNVRRSYVSVGQPYRYDSSHREKVYRNDNRVAVRTTTRRTSVAHNNGTARKGYQSAARSESTVRRTTSVSHDKDRVATSRTTTTRVTKAPTAQRQSVSRSTEAPTTARQTTYRNPETASSRSTAQGNYSQTRSATPNTKVSRSTTSRATSPSSTQRSTTTRSSSGTSRGTQSTARNTNSRSGRSVR